LNSKKIILPLIILIAFLLRLYFLLNQTDLSHLDFYEYGAIAENMHKGYGYSLFYFDNGKIEIGSSDNITPYTSAYMPPVYTFIVYLFYFIQNIEIRNFSLIFFQILLSLLVVYVIYLLTKEIFNLTAAIITGLLTAILPEFVYASCVPGTTIFFHLGIGVILLLLYRLDNELKPNFYPILIGATFGVVILFRSEVLLLLLIIFMYYVIKKRFKQIAIIVFTSFIIIAPWSIRNFLAFEEYVPLSTSAGVNFYRGHNPYDIGIWADQNINDNLLEFRNDPNFELRMNGLLLDKGFESITNNPIKHLEYTITKIFHLWIFNPQDERTMSFFYLLPWGMLVVMSLICLSKSFNWQNQKYLYLFLIYFQLIVIIFLCLPRYQTMMKLAVIPFAGEGLMILANGINNRFQERRQ